MKPLRLLLAVILLPVEGLAAGAPIVKAKVGTVSTVKTAAAGSLKGLELTPPAALTLQDLPVKTSVLPLPTPVAANENVAAIEQALDIMADPEQPKLESYDGADYQQSKAGFVVALEQLDSRELGEQVLHDRRWNNRARVRGKEGLGTRLKRLLTHPGNFTTLGPLVWRAPFEDAWIVYKDPWEIWKDPEAAMKALMKGYRKLAKEELRGQAAGALDPLEEGESFDTGIEKLLASGDAGRRSNASQLLQRVLEVEAAAAARGDSTAPGAFAHHFLILSSYHELRPTRANVELIFRAAERSVPTEEAVDRVMAAMDAFVTL